MPHSAQHSVNLTSVLQQTAAFNLGNDPSTGLVLETLGRRM